ncbi:hypothetical protein; putative transmembrane protein [Cupriavidus taiwanensis]|uniref:Uncharacterized protein n=1 Tax=Cupriavidus taiwanensis TaxID=164546 RepID=A0A976ATM1_9BURK|nr:hypothetical protein [Cupriavidus taiwanensis]SOZ49520.1 hypothetical protein; putative transmembrane protein [Cupriavidus taiwanensis]SOZ49995.1 hypothetical protein; putative transmembrane protein [Cupriavidus taiwanensis]SOZ53107.1 hypothetical protein; putative transmembrane protein [Cupriavidus taiwanensis]SPA00289.1 hypothetical protein; putative transmembrane protein [Cupriavidus taiwanensis]SPA07274.1 hypothetical protein; putative transmembrane protein [Cupriavidus taiwanensis]
MSAADRFIAGEDRLSALLKALPAYPPPPALEAAVLAAARAAQQDAGRHQAGAPDLPFAAPPALAAAVLEEAARLQAAQSARRDAVLARVAAGAAAEDVLGARLGPDAAAWLRAQAADSTRNAAQPSTMEPSTHAARVRRWWRSLGLVASVAAVAGLTTSIVLRQIDDGALMPAGTAEIAATEMAAPAPTPAPAASTAPSPTLPETAAAPTSKPAAPAARAAPPAARPAPRAAPGTEATRNAPREPAPDSEALAQASPAAPQAPADAAMAQAAPSAPAPAASPAYALEAAPAMAARAPAAASALIVSTRDDPAAIAARLGTAAPLRLWAAEPDHVEIREWAQRLWQAMPAGQRPPVPVAVQADPTLAPGQVRIELRGELPPGTPH